MKKYLLLFLLLLCANCSLSPISKEEGVIKSAVNLDSTFIYETLNDSLIKLKYNITYYSDGIITPIFYRNYSEEYIDTVNIYALNRRMNWPTTLPNNGKHFYKIDSTFKKLNKVKINQVYQSDKSFGKYDKLFDVLFMGFNYQVQDTILIPPEKSILIFTEGSLEPITCVYFSQDYNKIFPFYIYKQKKIVKEFIYFKPFVLVFGFPLYLFGIHQI